MTAFRAAMIIGSGSASFKILRYLAERLPVLVAAMGSHGIAADRLNYPDHSRAFI